MEEVTINISPNGSIVKVDAQGFTGGTCKDFMGSVLKALGETTEEKKKSDFYKTAQNGIKIGG